MPDRACAALGKAIHYLLEEWPYLIALGVAGVLPPTTSALMHNGSTLCISLRNMTDLLDDEENPRK